MISRLTILAAIVNLGLSGFIVYTIVDIKSEAKNYVPTPITINKTTNNSINDQINKTVGNNSTNTETKNNNEQSATDANENKSDNQASNIKNYVLTEEELKLLIDSGNPFGSSLGGDMTTLKQKIKEQTKEDRTINESTNLLSEDTSVTDKDTTSNSSGNQQKILELAELKAKKYDIPSSWVIGVIRELSNFDENLTSQDGETTRQGIMQIRKDKISFIMDNIGTNVSSEKDVATNIEMGAYYLSYLSKQNKDEHYPFTAYYLGPSGADKLFKDTGSYETEFSRSIIKRTKET